VDFWFAAWAGDHSDSALDIKTSKCICLDVRTTLTLDDDVAATLERLRRSRRIGLKQLINEALRRGLKDLGRRRGPREPVRTEAVALGRLRVASIDNISEVFAIVEGESFK
jgi:hypothetical protein